MYIIYLFFFLFGITLGSFYNVIAYRIIKRDYKGIFTDRSYCPKCDTKLKPKDLIPLVSYIWLRGKCRYCQAKISAINFWFELITGIVFMIVYYVFPYNWFFVLIIASILLILTNIIYRNQKRSH